MVPIAIVLRRLTSPLNSCKHQRFLSCYFNKSKEKSQDYEKGNTRFYVFSSVIAGYAAYQLLDKKHVLAQSDQGDKVKNGQCEDILKSAGAYRDDLPTFSVEELSEHVDLKSRVWVTMRRGVYDITEFISEHPGGEQIMMAAGNSVEPFWVLYAIHYNEHVLKILESYRIGNVSLEVASNLMQDMTDPYGTDPKRHVILKPASNKPFNAETPESLLVESFITPNEFFYVRNHLPVPEIDPQTYELEIEIEGNSENAVQLSLDDLKKFPKHSVTATVMCAGNRRSEMSQVKSVKGLSWGAAAVGNAVWTGARLQDVLKNAGLNASSPEYKHIQFEGYDIDATGTSYGASIPFWKGVDRRGDVILAYEMNGAPIPRDHGFPVRVIVPGTVGARNVKWLARIVVSENESNSHWQQNDYKGFSPSTTADDADYSKSPAIQELPVTSAICQPAANTNVRVVDGKIKVKGYAWSGGGQRIARVDVTLDGGKTWHVATFDSQSSESPPQHWTWTLWSAELPVPYNVDKVEIWAKAVDTNYNTQPEGFENIWNFRGVLSNAYHRVPITLKRQ